MLLQKIINEAKEGVVKVAINPPDTLNASTRMNSIRNAIAAHQQPFKVSHLFRMREGAGTLIRSFVSKP